MSIATHILLTTDFSEAADVAVYKASELARTLGAKPAVLNVHGFPPAVPGAPVASPPGWYQLLVRTFSEIFSPIKVLVKPFAFASALRLH